MSTFSFLNKFKEISMILQLLEIFRVEVLSEFVYCLNCMMTKTTRLGEMVLCYGGLYFSHFKNILEFFNLFFLKYEILFRRMSKLQALEKASSKSKYFVYFFVAKMRKIRYLPHFNHATLHQKEKIQRYIWLCRSCISRFFFNFFMIMWSSHVN